MITGDLMSLNSHKSFGSSSPFLYSLKRRRRKVGLSQGCKVPSKCSAKLKMRGGMASNAKTHTEREREREWGCGAQHSPRRSLLNAGLCLCITSTSTSPRPFSQSASAKAKYFREVQRRGHGGHSEGVRGPRWLMKHTWGGGGGAA